jgi:hypothetical protein
MAPHLRTHVTCTPLCLPACRPPASTHGIARCTSAGALGALALALAHCRPSPPPLHCICTRSLYGHGHAHCNSMLLRARPTWGLANSVCRPSTAALALLGGHHSSTPSTTPSTTQSTHTTQSTQVTARLSMPSMRASVPLLSQHPALICRPVCPVAQSDYARHAAPLALCRSLHLCRYLCSPPPWCRKSVCALRTFSQNNPSHRAWVAARS